MSLESEKYNKIYSENEAAFGAGKPEKIVADILTYKQSGSALELGAGQGRNSLFLAQNGFEVTAQDVSEVGLDKIKKQAEEKSIAIKTELVDSRTLNLNENFDVIVSTFMLHHVSRDEALKIIALLQEHTNMDGINAITTFTQDGDFYNRNSATTNFYPVKNELRDLYVGWEILEYEEVEGAAFAQKLDGSPMINVSAKLLARKIK